MHESKSQQRRDRSKSRADFLLSGEQRGVMRGMQRGGRGVIGATGLELKKMRGREGYRRGTMKKMSFFNKILTVSNRLSSIEAILIEREQCD